MRRYLLLTTLMTVTGCTLYACSSDSEAVDMDPDMDAAPDTRSDTRIDEVEDSAADSGTDSATEDGDADAAPPPPANFVVLRQGQLDGGLLHVNAAQVFLDEYTQAGALVRTISLPTAPAGGNLALVQSSLNYGPSNGGAGEGLISRSADGHSIVIAGYSSPAPNEGLPVPPGAAYSSAENPRTIGVVDATGNVTIRTSINDAFGHSSIRAATTNDGSAFWSAGGVASPPPVNIMYNTVGSDGGGVAISGGFGSNPRTGIGIFDGQLYVASSFGAEVGVYRVGTGLPTTADQTISPVVPITTGSVWGFAFVDTDANPGIDTLYVAAAPDGIKKYKLEAGSWSSVATFANGLTAGAFGVAAVKEDAGVILFVTTFEGDKILKYVDDGVVTDPTAVPIATTTTFDGGTGYVYRGTAVAPVP